MAIESRPEEAFLIVEVPEEREFADVGQMSICRVPVP